MPLITAIGASLFLQNTARGFFGPQTRGYPKPELLDGHDPVGQRRASTQIDPVVVVTAIVAMVTLQIFVARTKTGKSMRAVAQDREIASLMGIDVDRIVVTHVRDRRHARGHRGRAVRPDVRAGGRPRWGSCRGSRRSPPPSSAGSAASAGAALGGLLLGVAESVGPSLLLTRRAVPVAVRAEGRGHVLDPGAGADLPAGRTAGHRRGGEGLMGGRAALGIARGLIGGIVVDLPRAGRHVRAARRPAIDRDAVMDTLAVLLPAAWWRGSSVRPRVVAGERRAATTRSRGRVRRDRRARGRRVVALGAPPRERGSAIETVRQIFIAVSPALIEILRFAHEPMVGADRPRSWSACRRSAGRRVPRPADVGAAPLATATAVTVLAGAPAADRPQRSIQLGHRVDWLYTPVDGRSHVARRRRCSSSRGRQSPRLVAILRPRGRDIGRAPARPWRTAVPTSERRHRASIVLLASWSACSP